ncbi:MAG: GFA family protein [Pseudomonadota bacterium]
MTTQEGGCLCGAIRFKVKGEPIIAGACYCHDCQRVAGGSPAYGILYPAAAVSITKGQPQSYMVKADSGSEVYRDFCPDCGVHLFARNGSREQFCSVKVGAFDDPSGFHSQGSIWTSSAQPWHCIEHDLPSWEKEPDMELQQGPGSPQP